MDPVGFSTMNELPYRFGLYVAQNPDRQGIRSLRRWLARGVGGEESISMHTLSGN